MKVFNGRYEGIRLYDINKNYITDLTWSQAPSESSWSELQEVPDGQ